jgi:hypothetical protein
LLKKKKNQEARLTAYCGLYCGDCIRYCSKTTQLAKDLMDELEAVQFDKYAAAKSAAMKELEHYNECLEVLGAIVKLGCDTPCQVGGEGCSAPCQIKRCIQAKGLNGCWECDTFEMCDKFEFLRPVHADAAKSNLRKIRKYGLNEWAGYRTKFYPWL